jgi:hypothetical protein
LLEYWYDALRSPRGILLEAKDRELARQQLYAARRAANDPDLEGLSIRFSPLDPTHLWIVKDARKKIAAPNRMP